MSAYVGNLSWLKSTGDCRAKASKRQISNSYVSHEKNLYFLMLIWPVCICFTNFKENRKNVIQSKYRILYLSVCLSVTEKLILIILSKHLNLGMCLLSNL